MGRARLGTTQVGGIELVYYPPEPGHWRMVALAIALTLGVGGSFALGQALGHQAPVIAVAHHPVVARPARTASGALSTAQPSPTAQPALPSAAPAQTRLLSEDSRGGGDDHRQHGHKGGGGKHHPKG